MSYDSSIREKEAFLFGFVIGVFLSVVVFFTLKDDVAKEGVTRFRENVRISIDRCVESGGIPIMTVRYAAEEQAMERCQFK